jgi:metal-responsive CopG/Arc/MetJ family transcriptional regulator
MAQKRRSPGQTAISFSIEKNLLAQIDERAAKIGLSRSTYLAALARADLAKRGDLILQEQEPLPKAKKTH